MLELLLLLEIMITINNAKFVVEKERERECLCRLELFAAISSNNMKIIDLLNKFNTYIIMSVYPRFNPLELITEI